MNYQPKETPGKWWHQMWVVPWSFGILAFAIGAAQMFFLPPAYQPVVPPLILVLSLGVYTLARSIYPFSRYRSDIRDRIIYGADIALSIFLVMLTGGFYSPFLVYTLLPVIGAGLYLRSRMAFAIAGLSPVYVVLGGHLWNPFLPTLFSAPELKFLSFYTIIVFLAAVLPYLININLRQRLQSDSILEERRRLSRELHDGVAQTLSALRWQIQLVQRCLIEMGIELDEVAELGKLATEAQQDTRECLELLRNYTGDGSFIPHLEDYLKHLNESTNIDFHLNIETGQLHLESRVELQLLRICQEALTNIRKHSGAHNVQVEIGSADSHLEVSIADDGCGFDALAFYSDGAHSERQGLMVMQERAWSIGGKLMVLSQPSSGSEVRLSIPIKKQRGDK